jgi:serine protease Do
MDLITDQLPGSSRERWLGLAVGLGLMLALGSSAGSLPGSYSRLIRQAAPSVVTVLAEQEPEDAARRAAERAASARDALADTAQKPVPSTDRRLGLGSGFIVDEDGFIVTNRHVIQGAANLRVRFISGRELPAQIVGVDVPTDIALLKVDARHLPALHLGSSTHVAVGDPVVAIGNPFGVGQSATAGIISARGRLLVGDPYIDFLQTDAAINHGNSGGPLLAADGAVIGVTSAILSPTGGSVGLGFAIPAETVAAVVRELRTHGRVARGYLGISAQPLTPDLAKTLGVIPAGGALVTAVDSSGPASQMILIGDVLQRMDSAPISFADLAKLTAQLRPDTMVELQIVRNRAPRTLYLTVGRLPEAPSTPGHNTQIDTWVPALGLGVAETSYEIRHAVRADDEVGGLIVTQLRPSGAGALAGLQIGDLITHLGTEPLKGVGQLASIDQLSATAPLLVRVVRDGVPQFMVISNTAPRSDFGSQPTVSYRQSH